MAQKVSLFPRGSQLKTPPEGSKSVAEIPVSSRKDSRKVPVRDTFQSHQWPDMSGFQIASGLQVAMAMPCMSCRILNASASQGKKCTYFVALVAKMSLGDVVEPLPQEPEVLIFHHTCSETSLPELRQSASPWAYASNPQGKKLVLFHYTHRKSQPPCDLRQSLSPWAQASTPQGKNMFIFQYTCSRVGLPALRQRASP